MANSRFARFTVALADQDQKYNYIQVVRRFNSETYCYRTYKNITKGYETAVKMVNVQHGENVITMQDGASYYLGKVEANRFNAKKLKSLEVDKADLRRALGLITEGSNVNDDEIEFIIENVNNAANWR